MDKIENIKNPDFLKDLNNDELATLGADIREFILENVSNTGGHLSSNLGITKGVEEIRKLERKKYLMQVLIK